MKNTKILLTFIFVTAASVNAMNGSVLARPSQPVNSANPSSILLGQEVKEIDKTSTIKDNVKTTEYVKQTPQIVNIVEKGRIEEHHPEKITTTTYQVTNTTSEQLPTEKKEIVEGVEKQTISGINNVNATLNNGGNNINTLNEKDLQSTTTFSPSETKTFIKQISTAGATAGNAVIKSTWTLGGFIVGLVTLRPLWNKILPLSWHITPLISANPEGSFSKLNSFSRFEAFQTLTAAGVMYGLYKVISNAYAQHEDDVFANN